MATIFDMEFIDVSIPILQRISGALPFDVYLKRADNTYTKLFPKNDVVDPLRLQDYLDRKGVALLYVHKNDYKQYLLYVEQAASAVFRNKSKIIGTEHLNLIKEMTDLTMLELIVQKQVDEKSIAHAATVMKGCLDVLAQDPRALVHIFKLMTTHPYLIKHSLSTAVFALLLAKKEKLESDKTLTALGLGAFCHDLGMSQISFDAEDKQELTPEEWKEVRRHPELGKRLVDAIKTFPMESKMIILQHHEQPNGSGYPNGLHAKEIYYLAKIVSIADSFSALVSTRPYRPEPNSPAKALEVMDMDRGKFDFTLLDQFKSIFIQVKPERTA